MLFDALRQAEEALFSASTQALTRGECEMMLNAADFVRARRERLVEDFLRHFEQRYVSACQYKPTVMTSYQIDFDASQLEFVKHDLLDDSLEPGKLAEAIQNAGWVSLQDLTGVFGKLLSAEAIKPNDMPLSPRLIEAAVSDATRDQLWRHEAKSLVIRSLRRFIPDRVGLIYRDLYEHLAPMVGSTERKAVSVCIPADAPLQHGEADMLVDAVAAPVIDGCVDASILLPANQAIEFALNVARGEAIRRQVGQPIELETGVVKLEVPEMVAVATCLPDPVVPAEPVKAKQNRVPIPPTIKQEQPPAARLPATLDELELGSWLEMRADDGVLTSLKVAWISPHKHLYLMTNRQRGRALSMASDELAAALREDRARIVMPRDANVSAGVVAGRHSKKTA